MNRAHPTESGYRMPAEWEPHAATWLTWPWPQGCSFPDNYESIIPVYAQLIRHVAEHETVRINVWDAELEERVRSWLEREKTPLENVRFHRHPSYEPWCRDHGPIFVVKEEGGERTKLALNWGYNAWGGKYPPYDLDNRIPERVAEARQIPLATPGMILEGGSIDVNGAGLLLTTESCLLNPNRNPDMNARQIEEKLMDFLGVQSVLWLGDGIAGDDTDGHIDDITRFVSASTVVTAVEDDPSDVNHEPLKENMERLKRMRDVQGNPLEVIPLPMPAPVLLDGGRLPASYLNFYIANGVVVVPTFNDPNDEKAIGILRELFPDRKVAGVDSRELIVGLGSFHCITQQEPL